MVNIRFSIVMVVALYVPMTCGMENEDTFKNDPLKHLVDQWREDMRKKNNNDTDDQDQPNFSFESPKLTRDHSMHEIASEFFIGDLDPRDFDL